MFTKPRLAITAPLTAMMVSFGALAMSAPAAAQTVEESPWHGFYAGVNAGGAWSTADADAVVTVNTTVAPPTCAAPCVAHPIVLPGNGIVTGTAHLDSGHHSTFTGGLEAGYNYVMDGGLLLGIETDVNIFDIRRSQDRQVIAPNGNSYGVYQQIDTDFLWTLRPRIGYAMDKFLVFASGGLALTTTHYRAAFTDNQSAASRILLEKSGTRTGWTVGGGAAYAISSNLSAKAEYLYQDFGSSRYSAASAGGYVTLDTEAHLRSHLFRAGLDYRF